MKYHNQKTIIDGIKFDSKKEANRWCELQLLEKAGIISNLQRQVTFELIPRQLENGKVIEKALKYIADFVYDENGQQVVEDCKGFKTKEYLIKRKIMLYKGIKIKET